MVLRADGSQPVAADRAAQVAARLLPVHRVAAKAEVGAAHGRPHRLKGQSQAIDPNLGCFTSCGKHVEAAILLSCCCEMFEHLQATARVTLLSSAIDAISRFPAAGLYSEGAMTCSVTARPCTACAMPTATSVTCKLACMCQAFCL